MMLISFSLISILFIMSILWLIWSYWNFRKDFIVNREKASAFECGFDGKNTFRSSFSFRFFYILIIFLIFDVELALLLGLPFSTNSPFLLFLGSIVLFILILGLVYEWGQGALDWKV